MAQVYHYDCRPGTAASDTYRTLNSKYAGTCHGCREPYDVSDKVAYFGDATGSRPATSTVPSTDINRFSKIIDQLEDKIKHLEFRLSKVEQSSQDFLQYKPTLDHVDFNRCPQLPRSPYSDDGSGRTKTEAIAAVFDGKEVEAF